MRYDNHTGVVNAARTVGAINRAPTIVKDFFIMKIHYVRPVGRHALGAIFGLLFLLLAACGE